jgi:hypothetical protein
MYGTGRRTPLHRAATTLRSSVHDLLDLVRRRGLLRLRVNDQQRLRVPFRMIHAPLHQPFGYRRLAKRELRSATFIGHRIELPRDPLCSAPHLEMLGTLSEDLVSAEAIVRAESGCSGWCAAEIVRAKREITV